MPGGPVALSAAAAIAAMLAALTGAVTAPGGDARSAEAAAGPRAEFVGRHVWRSADERHGGWSALELDGSGARFLALSDRGSIVQGQILRDGNGAVRGVSSAAINRLRDTAGRPVRAKAEDAEGLALRQDGRFYVSFEGQHRVWTYPAPGARAAWIEQEPRFGDLQFNSGLEALAIDDAGALYALPERSGREDRPFPVWRRDRRSGAWAEAFALPRRGDFLPVGADFGPDGRLYLLERDFNGIFGFASRVRRFRVGPGGISAEETLLTTRSGRHDNLEGIAAWRDGAGAIRLTLLSDDNFRFFQTTEFVDYRVTE